MSEPSVFQALIVIIQVLVAVLLAIIGYYAKQTRSDIAKLTESLVGVRLEMANDFVKYGALEGHREKLKDACDRIAQLSDRVKEVEVKLNERIPRRDGGK